METQAQRGSDELNWKLAGIRAEKGKIEERLKYLQDEERRLTGQGLTGQPRNGKVATAPKGKQTKPAVQAKRTRNLSPETREKMRQAAQRRWAKEKGTEATQTPTEVQAPAEATPEQSIPTA